MVLNVDLMLGFAVGYLVGWVLIPQPVLVKAIYDKVVKAISG